MQYPVPTCFDSHTLLTATRCLSHIPGTVLLYSGGYLDSAQQSFLCLFPYDVIKFHHGVFSRGGLTRACSNPWEMLQQELVFESNASSYPDWVGYLGYEMGASSDLDKQLPHQVASTPDLYLQKCGAVLTVDHATGKGTLCVRKVEKEEGEWIERLLTPDFWRELNEGENDVKAVLEPVSMGEVYEDYARKIAYAQELIRAGEIYQVNLSQQFVMQGKADPFTLFEKISTINPAPFSAFMKLGGFSIVSSSPERFLCKKGDLLETRPIKGTIPRGSTPLEDAKQRQKLLSSPKECAELLMITDLMRNDLGRVSVPGSVKVQDLWRCEGYTNVFHMLSIIQSQVLPTLSPVEIVRRCFPAGSITGCPKLRSMEVIAEIEQRPRGIYTGAIGYFARNGDFDFNVAIRTLVMEQDRHTLQLGGAIVIDSDARAEYEETLHKGTSIFQVLT